MELRIDSLARRDRKMHDGNPSRWRPIGLTRLRYVALCLIAWCVLIANPQWADAQIVEPDLTDASLVDGQWVATFQVSGPISGPNFSGTVTYTGRAEFTSSGGEVSGGWTMLGTSHFSGECF